MLTRSGEIARLRSTARSHPVLTAGVALLLVAGLLGAWMLLPPRFMGDLQRSAKAHERPPAPIAQVVPQAGELCSDEINRHPAREVDGGRYQVNPNEWNAVGGLCVRTDGGSDFRISQSGVNERTVVDPDRGPGAYAHITTPLHGGVLPIRVDNLRYAVSSWTTSTIDSGTWNASYDLWFSPVHGECSFTESAELMIWIDSRGKKPSGEKADDPVRIGGLSYTVYQLPKKSSHTVIVYLLEDPASSVRDLDLRAFALDAAQRGYVPRDSELCSVQAGFEVWEGGVGLRTDSFSFDAAVGLPRGAVTSGVPGMCLAAPSDGRTPGVATCDASPAQEWTKGDANTLVQDGRCLEAGRGGTVYLAPCTGAVAQKWQPGPSDALVSPASGKCLAAGDPAPGRWSVPRLQPCERGPAQTWYPPT
ncbi:GH12 family glycosyl hydrolase domain-containing protein [Yinghuangia sp. YIM S09857]|uniref:GH12 family glycosyl hydrolase domain-containing protein n=1 Tax=Yinghuangia sp. YIM S09857 TaxID=3436929 RepID=UPI003F532A65